MKISKKLKLIIFLLFSLVCGFIWINSSVSVVFTKILFDRIFAESITELEAKIEGIKTRIKWNNDYYDEQNRDVEFNYKKQIHYGLNQSVAAFNASNSLRKKNRKRYQKWEDLNYEVSKYTRRIDTKLDYYWTKIQLTLENFANSKIKKIKIGEKTYQIDRLVVPVHWKVLGSQLPQFAKNQLLVLARVEISPETFKNTLLEIYRLTIVDNLNALQDNNISQIIINNKTYSLTELIKPINKNKVVSLLSSSAKTELAVLAKNVITKTQLDTALVTAKKAAVKAFQVQKKSEQRKLIIGLSVTGGIFTLSSLGCFFYWFLKVKK